MVLSTQTTYAQAACLAVEQAMTADPPSWCSARTSAAAASSASTPACRRASARSASSTRRFPKSTIMGAGVGMALAGLRPVVEMRVVDFALCAMDEIVNQAAKNRFMFGGQGRVPLVARLPIGIWTASAAQHSQSLGGVVRAPARAGGGGPARRRTTTNCCSRHWIAAIR